MKSYRLGVCAALAAWAGVCAGDESLGAHRWGQPAQTPVAAISADGNLLLRGELVEFATGLESGHQALWRVEDDGEAALALLQVDAGMAGAKGDLLIAGMVTTGSAIAEPTPPTRFVFRKENAAGVTIAALDDTGNLYITGVVVEEAGELGPVEVDSLLDEGLTVVAWGEILAARLDWNEAFPEPREALYGYDVYRATAPEGPYTRANPAPELGTDYLDTGLSAGVTYYYKIQPVSLLGYTGAMSEAASCTPEASCAGIHPTGW